MTRPLIGAALAGLAMFVWGFVFWGSGLVDAFDHFTTPAAEQAVADALRRHVTAPGVYFVPDQPTAITPETQKAWIAAHERGPIARLVVRPEGRSPMAPTKFLFGYLHMLATALLMAAALRLAAIPCVRRRAAVGVAFAVAAALWAQLVDPIWFDAPIRHHLFVLAYDIVSLGLAALILARFTDPPATAPGASAA